MNVRRLLPLVAEEEEPVRTLPSAPLACASPSSSIILRYEFNGDRRMDEQPAHDKAPSGGPPAQDDNVALSVIILEEGEARTKAVVER
jgi:hypothetical protein